MFSMAGCSCDRAPWHDQDENYIINEVQGGTELIIELDSNEDLNEMFETIYPKALEIVKRLAEDTSLA